MIHVTKANSFAISMRYIYSKLKNRVLRTRQKPYDASTGDVLVILNDSMTAEATYSTLKAVCGGLNNYVTVQMIGPMPLNLDTSKKPSFCQGVVLSQTLESYSSDYNSQYGLRNVHTPCGVEGKSELAYTPLTLLTTLSGAEEQEDTDPMYASDVTSDMDELLLNSFTAYKVQSDQ